MVAASLVAIVWPERTSLLIGCCRDCCKPCHHWRTQRSCYSLQFQAAPTSVGDRQTTLGNGGKSSATGLATGSSGLRSRSFPSPSGPLARHVSLFPSFPFTQRQPGGDVLLTAPVHDPSSASQRRYSLADSMPFWWARGGKAFVCVRPDSPSQLRSAFVVHGVRRLLGFGGCRADTPIDIRAQVFAAGRRRRFPPLDVVIRPGTTLCVRRS